MTAPRRLLVPTTALELLRRRVLGLGGDLPPGFALEADPTAPDDAVQEAVQWLLQSGAATGDADGAWTAHPSVAGDLRVLAAPELAVSLRAGRPGLDVTACLAVSGLRGAGLLRTGPTAVQLSAFEATGLTDELARVVPAALDTAGARVVEEVPLDALLDSSAPSLRGRVTGTLHATVLAGARPDRPAGAVGSIEWVWDGAGWIGLEPLPARQGRPWVRLVPVQPADVGSWLAPLVAAAAA